MDVDLFILSDIRFIREGLADVIGRGGVFRIAGVAADVDQACRVASFSPIRVILVDTSIPEGVTGIARLRECLPDAKIIAFALVETEAEVIAWARAGICGYIPRETPLTGLVELLERIVLGEQVCATRIASGMLRWIAQHAAGSAPQDPNGSQIGLTAREQQVAHLMDGNLSNKEIARRLGISVATTKSHVHNILAKVGARKRDLACLQLRERRVITRRIGVPPESEQRGPIS